MPDAKNSTNPCISEAVGSFTKDFDKYFANVTNGQLVDGWDTFYKDYRNRSIKAHDEVWLVVNEIAGTPKAEMDRMIENWPQNAGKTE